ncbi:hypothetical protein SEA_WEASELS2_26 [Rhodococcus phage Weasels2]|uniref:Uncharacterized protein n=1 Tax=Rhodococcus phage Weasels2 TaxID=1897437 RepID=A0A1I9SA10_9CAUD|nr:hypothetical protein FDH04_gp026 [Rhodococcus phage Weasels2]AOZ63616.1 hypothetical protein SEA_WEASELS2_26 [Rhodococcus phage Weasels2]
MGISKSFNWDMSFYEEQYQKAEALRLARLEELGLPITWMGHDKAKKEDLEYVKILLDQQYYETAWTRANISRIAYRERDRNHVALGKQYGKASQTIRQLRAELALAKETYRQNISNNARYGWFQ